MTEEVKTEEVEAPVKNKRKRLSKDTSSGDSIVITEVETGETVEVALADLSEEIIQRLTMHGLSQKLGDSAAGKTGEDAINAVKETARVLMEGIWASKVAGTGGAGKAISASKLKKALNSDNFTDEEREAAKAVLSKLNIDTSKFGI